MRDSGTKRTKRDNFLFVPFWAERGPGQTGQKPKACPFCPARGRLSVTLSRWRGAL